MRNEAGGNLPRRRPESFWSTNSLFSNVGFLAAICRVACREIRPTRQASSLWLQCFRCDLSGLSGFYREERAPEKSDGVFRGSETSPRTAETAAPWRREMDSGWTPPTAIEKSAGCISMRNLVGLPGFEPGTSCTPSNKYLYLTDPPH
jgi:hypothetical protein